MKKLIKKILFPNTYSSKAYIKYLRKKGVKIGDNCYIWSPNHTMIDTQNPCMLEIGDYVKVTYGVKILTHDYSVSVARRFFGEHIGQAKLTHIGNNVFIGMDSIILPGAFIGDNVIIGAGSIVRGQIPSNVVVAGNPAKIIITLDEFYKSKKEKEYNQAKNYVYHFFEKNNRIPSINEMGNAFAWLYLPRNKKSVEKFNHFFKLSGDSYEEVIDDFMHSVGMFNSYIEFLKSIDLEENVNEAFKAAVKLYEDDI